MNKLILLLLLTLSTVAISRDKDGLVFTNKKDYEIKFELYRNDNNSYQLIKVYTIKPGETLSVDTGSTGECMRYGYREMDKKQGFVYQIVDCKVNFINVEPLPFDL